MDSKMCTASIPIMLVSFFLAHKVVAGDSDEEGLGHQLPIQHLQTGEGDSGSIADDASSVSAHSLLNDVWNTDTDDESEEEIPLRILKLKLPKGISLDSLDIVLTLGNGEVKRWLTGEEQTLYLPKYVFLEDKGFYGRIRITYSGKLFGRKNKKVRAYDWFHFSECDEATQGALQFQIKKITKKRGGTSIVPKVNQSYLPF